MTTDLVPASHYGLQQLVEKASDPMAAVDRAAVWFARSGLFGCDRIEQGAMLALTCLSEGISPVEFARTYDIVSGKLRKKAAAAYAQFRQRGGKVVWTKSGDDGQMAAANFTFEGQTVLISFSIDQAKMAGLVKADSGWVKNPSNMLRARVLSNAIGMLAPEIYAGENEDVQSPAPASPTLALAETAPPPPVVVTTAPVVTPVVATAAAADDVPMSYPATQQQAQPAPLELMPDERAALSAELQDQLIALITPPRLARATSFCRSIKWLRPDDGLEMLSEKHARQIITKADSFIKKVEEHVL